MGFLNSIRVRLSLLNAAVILLLFIVMGSVLVGIAENQFMREIDHGLVERARRFLPPMDNGRGPGQGQGQGDGQGNGPGPGPRNQGQQPGQTAQFQPNQQPGQPRGQFRRQQNGPFDDPESQALAEIRSPRVIRMDGSVAGPSDKTEPWDKASFERAKAVGEDLVTITREGRLLRLASVRVGRPEIGQVVVQAARELDDFVAVRGRLIFSLLILLPFVMAASIGAGLFLMGRAMKPVAKMTKAAEEMGEQDLSRRLSVDSADEFGQLATTFNGLLERLEQAFLGRAAAYAQLERLFEQQKRMTADASHELRTPLSRIKLVASASLAQDDKADEYKEALTTINQTADEMAGLVQQMLDLARAESGLANMAVISPRESANSAWKSLGSPNQVQVSIPESISMAGSANALQQIFRNLIENAIRHSPSDSPIVISAYETQTEVILKVQDSGEGIDPQHLPHLTERFYRAHPDRARESGGSGLGLSICAALAESMGGTMEFQSQIGHGTTVSIKFSKNFSKN